MRKIELSQPNQLPPGGPKSRIVFLAGGLIVILILGAIGSWYLFGATSRTSPAEVTATSIDSPAGLPTHAQTEELPQETPEGEPEEEAPGTPVPGFTDHFDNGLNPARSEEHTSELQSPYVISYAVFCLKK